jgi:hypothetical protein
MRRLRVVFALINLLILGICAWAAHASWFELFMEIPGAHHARGPDPWNTPKIAVSFILVSAVLGGLVALASLVTVRVESVRLHLALHAVELAALAGILAGLCVWVIDFFSSAGQFG